MIGGIKQCVHLHIFRPLSLLFSNDFPVQKVLSNADPDQELTTLISVCTTVTSYCRFTAIFDVNDATTAL